VREEGEENIREKGGLGWSREEEIGAEGGQEVRGSGVLVR